ncbi:single-stranded DNA-binding protein [Leucobacter sp. 1207-22]|uniref:single-stranded DNA-binding protein n=1 Tax=Leucobacter sp. 1207-22 TaxID=2604456 RepID=UPI004064AF83
MSQPVTVVGQIATVPRFHRSASGVEFCSFRLASTSRRFDREGNKWVDSDTNWFTVHLFRRLATHARESFAKGERVLVHGRLRVRQWVNDEKSGTAVEIDAEAVGHDLLWGVSSFSKRPLEPERGDDDAEQATSSDTATPTASSTTFTAPAPQARAEDHAENRELIATPF